MHFLSNDGTKTCCCASACERKTRRPLQAPPSELAPWRSRNITCNQYLDGTRDGGPSFGLASDQNCRHGCLTACRLRTSRWPGCRTRALRASGCWPSAGRASLLPTSAKATALRFRSHATEEQVLLPEHQLDALEVRHLIHKAQSALCRAATQMAKQEKGQHGRNWLLSVAVLLDQRSGSGCRVGHLLVCDITHDLASLCTFFLNRLFTVSPLARGQSREPHLDMELHGRNGTIP